MKKLLASIFQTLTDQRTRLYSKGVLRSVRIPCQVLSVGNLSVGGTGKTPVADWILKEALKRNLKTVLIARNYKAKRSGTHRVDFKVPKAAEIFGDEPTLLAMKNPEVPVFVSEKKWKAAQRGLEVFKPQLLVIDDGFQHFKLERDFNLLLLDVSRPWSDYHVIPKGVLREPLQAAERADLIVLTKVQNKNPETWSRLKESLPENIPTAILGYRLVVGGFGGASTQEISGPVIFCSGLAHSESFFVAVREQWKIKEFKKFIFPDHHQFSITEIKKIEDEATVAQARILVTEKDWIKLKDLTQRPDLYQVIEVQLYWEKPPESLYEFLDQII
ncbi:MAG: tetraacyldisaccharide 4'-kinase [Proteobacteria bacterium]|nr:tetraacyldisaccharide 4'-kinase [Pseudomonadota bacterium]